MSRCAVKRTMGDQQRSCVISLSKGEDMKFIENSLFKITEKGEVISSTGRSLKFQKSKKGYLSVKIYFLDKTVKRKSIHRLVALAFIPNPNNLPVVNHKDGNKLNNCVDNLEWTTVEYNTWHAANILQAQKGDKATNRTIDSKIATKVCEMLVLDMRSMDIAEQLNIPRNIVRDIRTRKTWTHISKNYPFVQTKYHKRKTFNDQSKDVGSSEPKQEALNNK